MNHHNIPTPSPDLETKQSNSRRKWIIGISIGVGLLIILGLVGQFSALIGARLIRQGSPRLAVRQGETVTLEIPSSERVQKLEICDDKETRILFGYRDFKHCSTLSYFVNPGSTQATVRIPTNYEGRAVVVVRQRGADNRLLTIAPKDAKIALWVNQGTPEAAQPTNPDGASGGENSSNHENSSNNDDSRQTEEGDNNPTPQKVTATISGGCIDNNDGEVHVHWDDTNVIAKHRKVGEDSWRSSSGDAYTDSEDGIRIALLFNSFSRPSYTDSDRLQTGDEFEIQLHPANNYSNPSASPSDVFRFTTPDLSQGFWTECLDF